MYIQDVKISQETSLRKYNLLYIIDNLSLVIIRDQISFSFSLSLIYHSFLIYVE